ncbi:MAG TPA: nuclear transport factor 2 family protein [Lysobacter sp.]
MRITLAPRSLALAFALAIAPAHATPARVAPGEDDIRAVIESFRTAIIQKDRARFLGLFVQDDVPWQSVLDDPSLAQVRAKHPDAIKARFKRENNPVAFIDGIVASRNASEETFSDIRIESDGDVATVTFDYQFLSNGRATNRGKECWLMVRTEAGWKITSLAYSVVLPPPASD